MQKEFLHLILISLITMQLNAQNEKQPGLSDLKKHGNQKAWPLSGKKGGFVQKTFQLPLLHSINETV